MSAVQFLPVTQFVAYAYKVLSKSNDLYKSKDGTLKDDSIVELVTTDLKQLLGHINGTTAPSSPAFVHFRDESVKLSMI